MLSAPSIRLCILAAVAFLAGLVLPIPRKDFQHLQPMRQRAQNQIQPAWSHRVSLGPVHKGIKAAPAHWAIQVGCAFPRVITNIDLPGVESPSAYQIE